ncbi:MAG: T9SS C-terminal target domain-containing protein, partial [Balneolaceae bacterium]
FLDYYAAQIYFVNTDWPHNNIDFWRLRVPYDESAPAGMDGRWRWMMFDVDYAFRLFGIWGKEFDMIEHLTSEFGVNGSRWPNLILRNLLHNENFRHQFINRIADHLNSTFKPNRVISEIDYYKGLLEPEIPEHSKRWITPTDFSEWNTNLLPLYEFAEKRPDYLKQHVINHFNLSSPNEITVNTSLPGQSTIKVNSLIISPDTPDISDSPYPWTGEYFSGVPVTITAIPSEGYVFSHWSGSLDSTEPSITVNPDADLQLTAHFVEDTGVPPGLVPFSFTHENSQFEESFADYRGSEDTLPDHMFVTWDEDRLANPFTGIGNIDSSNPETEYGNFTAYTSDGQEFSFGIRERAPQDLRNARLFFAFTNDTDEPIRTFRVSYDVEAWFIGDRRNRIRLKYDDLVTSDERSTFETDIFSTDNPSSTITPGTKVNGSLVENRTRVSGVVDITEIDNGTGVPFSPLEPGETAYFRWQFSNTSGDQGSLRSGLAVNNISIRVDDASGVNPIEYTAGWNLGGLPIDEGPLYYQSVFNNISQPPYLFTTAYVESENFTPGVGYWIHLTDAETVNYTGEELSLLNLELNEGWNLVSGLSHTLSETTVQDDNGIIDSPWYGFNKAYYPASNIEPGYGYWVRASEPGTITLEHSAEKILAANQTENPWQRFNPEEKFHALHFISETDTLQTLYFGGDLPEEVSSSRFVMPPVPPAEAFDGRFAGIESRLAEGNTPQIALQAGEHEVEVHLQSPGLSSMESWEMVQMTGDGRTVDRQGLRDCEAIVLHSADVTQIELVPQGGHIAEEPDLPNRFALEQNYPNPFNPITQIRYQLPVSSEVRLDVYDMTGRHVASLVNGQVSAGTHTLNFDARNLSSGVYMYRLQAGGQIFTRQLTLIK